MLLVTEWDHIFLVSSILIIVWLSLYSGLVQLLGVAFFFFFPVLFYFIIYLFSCRWAEEPQCSHSKRHHHGFAVHLHSLPTPLLPRQLHLWQVMEVFLIVHNPCWTTTHVPFTVSVTISVFIFSWWECVEVLYNTSRNVLSCNHFQSTSINKRVVYLQGLVYATQENHNNLNDCANPAILFIFVLPSVLLCNLHDWIYMNN